MPNAPDQTGPEQLSIPDALARAHAHWNAGQAEQAEMLCQRVLSAWPSHPDAAHLMGLMAHAYGNLDIAITYLRQACASPRAPAVYASNLAEMCRQKGLLIEAEAAARRAVAQEPAMAGGWNNLGIILQEMGKLEESWKCLEHVLTLQPHNAEAYNNLGNTAKRLGRNEEAQRAWSHALKLNPNYAQPYSNIANLLSDQADYAAATQHARRAIELDPRFIDAYINLAGIEIAQNNFPEALRWLEALLSFAPAHSSALACYALALKKLDRVEEALDQANQAVFCGPENSEAHNALGQVLQEMGKFDAALAAYDRAASLPGTATEQALVSRAVLLMENGQQTAAQVAFAQAIEAFPRSASAQYNRADLKKFKPEDPAIATMEALIAANPTYNDTMQLHFALGKAYMDVGDSDRAFEHLNKGNRAKRAIINYDSANTTRWKTAIIKRFTSALLKRFEGQGAMSAMPIFIVGMPRSGTTLLEQILASHPLIEGVGELNHIQNIAGGLDLVAELAADISPEKLKNFGQQYLNKIIPLAAGHPYVVDKMPINFAFAGFIHLILPGARIIHSRRDAADTCLSCYSKLFAGLQSFSYDQTELGHFHRMYQELMAHWREVLPPSCFLEVDYEAVTENAEAQTRRLLAFLGLEWDPRCLNFYNTKRSVKTASVNQVRQPIYKTSAGRWRKYQPHLEMLLTALNSA